MCACFVDTNCLRLSMYCHDFSYPFFYEFIVIRFFLLALYACLSIDQHRIITWLITKQEKHFSKSKKLKIDMMITLLMH